MRNLKFKRLIEILKNMQSAILAYSGGVDSTFLLKALQISGIKALAVTSISDKTHLNDFLMAKKMTAETGIEHRLIETEELLMEEFVRNTPDRCFFCKEELYKKLTNIAVSEGYNFLLDGSNIDDTFDYRPGRDAAKRYNVRSPLIEVGFKKVDIREKSRELGLATWNKTSSPCLTTRFPYGQRITREALKRVEKAEDFLKGMGFKDVRVRVHDSVARIEVGEEEIKLILAKEMRSLISEKLKSLGYEFISLDLDGYIPGSMNRVIKKHKNNDQF